MRLRGYLTVLGMVTSTVLAYSQTTLIRAGHLIDPANGTVTENQSILIEGEQITEVGAQVQPPDGTETIDLSDAWVMPGLIDAHAHLTLNLPHDVPPGMQLEMFFLTESSAFRALRGIRNAGIVLETGFTTVRDVGNDANYTATDLRRAIAKEWFVGPTIINSGKIIGAFGGQSEALSPEQGHPWRYEYIDADTPDEIRKAVRQNIYYGAKVIKLVADNSSYYYTEEEIRAAAEETHRAGLKLAVHVTGGEAARNVILGGADSIEHGYYLSSELLRLMKEHGTFLVGTNFPLEHLAAMKWFEDDPTPIYNSIVDRLRRAHEIGVKMAFGPDVVVDLPGKNRGEMAMDYLNVWEAAGVPPAKILKCMTSNGAELLQIQDERGAIAAGQVADIIATVENPLENIHALRKIHFVMKDGQVVK